MATKILLPKRLTGAKFDDLLLIDMNSFDIDGFLSVFFFTVLSQGSGIAKQVNDPTQINRYIQKLRDSLTYEHVNESERDRLIEDLVRSTLILTANSDRGANREEKISAVLPYTILTHKTGLPDPSSYMRNVDKFIFAALKEEYANNADALVQTLKKIFGKSVEINKTPDLGGRYTGEEPIDILTRLCIAFLDGFETVKMRSNKSTKVVAPACPTLTHELARDLLKFMNIYHETMPIQAFTYALQALISFELFIYTLKLINGTNELLTQVNKHGANGVQEEIPIVFRDTFAPSAPSIYVDFTQNMRSASRDMAQRCVRRDVESMTQFVFSNLYLRQLDAYVKDLKKNPQYKQTIEAMVPDTTKGPEYIIRLANILQDQGIAMVIDVYADRDLEEIRKQNGLEPEEDEDEDAAQKRVKWFNDIADVETRSFERLIYILREAQSDSIIKNHIKWYHFVGGLRKPFGILAGDLKVRQGWRYEPSNDLLSVWVQVAAVRLNGQNDPTRPIRLADFLTFLREHYGIVIDRPPEMVSGTEYIAAAQENLRALQTRLRQMGIFRGMSDDFTAQYLYPPFAQ